MYIFLNHVQSSLAYSSVIFFLKFSPFSTSALIFENSLLFVIFFYKFLVRLRFWALLVHSLSFLLIGVASFPSSSFLFLLCHSLVRLFFFFYLSSELWLVLCCLHLRKGMLLWFIFHKVLWKRYVLILLQVISALICPMRLLSTCWCQTPGLFLL